MICPLPTRLSFESAIRTLEGHVVYCDMPRIAKDCDCHICVAARVIALHASMGTAVEDYTPRVQLIYRQLLSLVVKPDKKPTLTKPPVTRELRADAYDPAIIVQATAQITNGEKLKRIKEGELHLQGCLYCPNDLAAVDTDLFTYGSYYKQYHGGFLCHDCLTNTAKVRQCAGCLDYFIVDQHTSFIDDELVCQGCAVYCHECPDCNNIYFEERGCICGTREGRVIHDYNYKPTFKYFLGSGERRDHQTQFIGLEFEVKCPNRAVRDRLVKRVYDYNWLYCVHDGSIGDFNFEVVTMPMTRNFYYAVARDVIADLLDQWRAAGCESWESNTCGFHIHINKASLYSTHTFKLLKLWLQNPGFTIDLAQRTMDDWFADYASFDQYENRTRDLVGRAKGDNPVKHGTRARGGYPAGRYSAINTTGSHTVEWRMFKGSLRLPVVEKNIEAVLASYDYTKRASLTGTNVPAFSQYVEHNRSRYPNLYRFLLGIGYINGQRVPSIVTEYRGD